MNTDDTEPIGQHRKRAMEAFGVSPVGDGIHDDTPAIASGGTSTFPPGIYLRGEATMNKELEIQEHCPDCGAKIGECHEPGCDVERCPFCGIQMLQDHCRYTYFGIDVETMEENWPWVYSNGLTDEMSDIYEAYLKPHLLKWDGVWPGVRECREYGLWSKWTEQGWQKCEADDPGATEGLNELAMRAHWDREARKYVLSIK